MVNEAGWERVARIVLGGVLLIVGYPWSTCKSTPTLIEQLFVLEGRD